MHCKYTYSYHLLQEKKIKKFFEKAGDGIREIFQKKFFRKATNPFVTVYQGGGTPIHHFTTTVIRSGGSVARWLGSVCCLLVKIPLFAFLMYFLRAYMLLQCNYTFLYFKRLKWALFCLMLIQKDYKYRNRFRRVHNLELFKNKTFCILLNINILKLFRKFYHFFLLFRKMCVPLQTDTTISEYRFNY